MRWPPLSHKLVRITRVREPIDATMTVLTIHAYHVARAGHWQPTIRYIFEASDMLLTETEVAFHPRFDWRGAIESRLVLKLAGLKRKPGRLPFARSIDVTKGDDPLLIGSEE